MIASRPVLGIDLGGTKILTAVVSEGHMILGRSKKPTPNKGPVAIKERLGESIEEALAQANLRIHEVEAIGLGVPGPIEAEAGLWLSSPNLHVDHYPIGPELEQTMGRPVRLANDVDIGAWGEYVLGAGRESPAMLAAFVGTGLGGAWILDGAIHHGFLGHAGEIGHMPVKENGPRCGCGRRGCLEALTSRTSIVKAIRKAAKKGQSTQLNPIIQAGGRVKSRDLAEAFVAGDPVTVEAIHRAARILGKALGGLVNVLGPERIVLGGGLSEALGMPYVRLIEEAARAQAMVDPQGRVRFALAQLGDDAGVLGASLMVQSREPSTWR